MLPPKTVTYRVVGEREADLKAGKDFRKLAHGKGLLGKVIGDVVEIQAPTGVIKFKIEAIGL